MTEEEINDTGLGYRDAKIQKEGLTDKPATKITKKASMSNKVRRKSVFRKRLGGGVRERGGCSASISHQEHQVTYQNFHLAFFSFKL